MTENILITYASRTGTTAGVADAIGKTLSEKGIAVDILPMKDVKDIGQYRAIIAGSAIQASKWLPEAIEFLQKNREEISKKPFAAFQVCMTLAMPNGEKYRQGVSEWMEPVRKIARPIKEGIFAGRLDLKSLPSFSDRLKFKISILMGVWKEGDHRNWNEIKQWAEDLIPILIK
ncbi:MAG: flavodoxin domain-containing protein [Bacteroidia bacterium]|nr:flavodoxin domain-containing protein [Bacteroidia bacterium]